MITGTQNPVVGKDEFYSFSDALDIFNSSNATFVWNIWKKNKAGSWIDITRKPEKMGTKVSFKFGEKVIGIEFKLQVFKATKKLLSNDFEAQLAGEIIVVPSSAKTPKIDRVVLFNQGAKDPNKASYKDALIARAYCVAMFNQEIEFRLWEDDAEGGGHNPTVNKNNQLPQVFKKKVNDKGIAEVKISLLSNEKVLRAIANKLMMSGDQSEGENHEYYVTASYAGKIQGASQVNVDVANPDHKTKPPQKSPTTSKKTSPNGAVFPGTSPKPMKQDSEKKITHAYFIDLKGNPVQKIAVGETVRIRIKTNNMVGENIQYIVWEYDLFGDPDKIIFSTAFKVPADTLDTQTLTITPERFKLGIDNKILYDPDDKEQQYFIEVIPLGTKAKSRKFGLDDEAKRMKVENGKSPAKVEKTDVKKVPATCICKEQYKDLIWGGKVSCDFRKKVVQICAELWGESRKMEMANGLMAVMNVETSGSFKGHQIMGKSLGDVNSITKDDFWLIKKNGEKTSRAVGLIQFTQPALQTIGEFTSGSGFDKLHDVKLRFAKMGEIKQLDYVKKYFLKQSKYSTSNAPEDIYLLVFGPEGVGKNGDYVLYKKDGDAEKYRQNKSVDEENNKDGKIQRSEILGRYKTSFSEGKSNKTKTFTCENSVTKANEADTLNSGFYIYRNGDIKYIQSEDTIAYYVQVEEGSNSFKKVNTLNKNSYDLVKFPDSGEGFNRYGGVDTGGKSSIENVGKGDHYLLPQTAAALYGLITEVKEKGWEIHFGDMSSENGSDPTSSPEKAKTHHAGHGHKGKQSGLNVDFRYLNKSGVSFQGVSSSSTFDDSKNKEVFKIAFKFGFNKNYATGKNYSGVNPKVGSHYDHGHFGTLSIEFETVEKIDAKIVK